MQRARLPAATHQKARAASSSVNVPTTLVSTKAAGTVDRPVDVALRGEIDDRARPMQGEQRVDARAVADVAADEDVPRVAPERFQAAEVAGVGELVEIDDGLGRARQPFQNEVGADEAGSAGDENHGIGEGNPGGRGARDAARAEADSIIGAGVRRGSRSSADTTRRNVRDRRRAACAARTR